MSNMLQYETSPYLRQHAQNPVDWYPWSEEAFTRAKNEDKPIFLSIGYSTCHWCHVMAHESFEDAEVADLLNRYFIAIKVDREERPDIDNIYMRACQAFTGGGGWPTSIFMTPDRKPFYAGTYFPKRSRRGMIGLMDLLNFIHDKWDVERNALLEQADEIVAYLSQKAAETSEPDEDLPEKAIDIYMRTFDRKNGGFGDAPKFPAPHNLVFLLACYQRSGRAECMEMADRTLLQMYRGGIYDHIGGGFSRYSTDERFLIPHFEKMLYDNALLILAYCKAHSVIGDENKASLYMQVAERTADYVLKEMTSPEGGFYSAQDADSEGEEGKYYAFTPREISGIVAPEHYESFCRYYGISERGNFEGKSILNLLNSDPFDTQFNEEIEAVYQYRRNRHALHLDDKILTAWNGLMIAAMCALYRESGHEQYLHAAQNADRFIRAKLTVGNELFASCASDRKGAHAFLDDYAAYCFAQLALYRVTLRNEYLHSARELCKSVLTRFHDEKNGGFFFSEEGGNDLFMRTKESYDGAVPSGNSLMAWNLVKLWQLTDEEMYRKRAERQLGFLASEASEYPAGYAMFLYALLEYENPAVKVVIVSDEAEMNSELPLAFPMEAALLLKQPSEGYPIENGRTTFYVCGERKCYPPVNDLREAARFIDVGKGSL